MPDTPPRSLETIIAEHAPLLERLARALVRDPERAADLVQDTWAAALRDPVAIRSQGVKHWLSVVLRRRWASTARRWNVRRTVGLQQAPQLTSSEVFSGRADPAVIAAKLEQQRLIQKALTDLAEPYRTAVVLRFQEGLSTAEIARRTGGPESTVRSQVQRGLTQMRERLDKAHPGGRAQWLATFAAGYLPTPTLRIAGATPLIPAALMGIKAWIVAAVSLAAISYFALTNLRSEATGDDPRWVQNTSVAPSPAALESLGVAPTKATERVAVGGGTVSTTMPDETKQEGPARVMYTGRVIDSDGQPIPGASVRHATMSNALRAQSWVQPLPTEQVVSDDEGRFAISRPGGRASLLVEKEGLAIHLSGVGPRPVLPQQGSVDTWAYGDIVLGPGFELTGRVLTPDDSPAVGATLIPMILGGTSTQPRFADYLPEAIAVTDASGSFHLKSLPAGRWALRTRHPQFLHAETAGEFGPDSPQSTAVVLRLRNAGRLSGTVRGLPEGYGTPGSTDVVTVSVRPVTPVDDVANHGYDENARRYAVDASGAFDVTGILPGSRVWLDLWTDNYSHYRTERRSARVTAMEGECDVALAYTGGFVVKFRAVHADTRAPIHLRRASVEFGTRQSSLTPPPSLKEDGVVGWIDGCVTTPPMVSPIPGAFFAVRLQADGMTSFHANFTGSETTETLDLGEIAVKPKEVPMALPLAAKIHVVDHRGAPLPLGKVEVTFPAKGESNPVTERLRADQHGIVEIRSLQTGRATVSVDPFYLVGSAQVGIFTSLSPSEMTLPSEEFRLNPGSVPKITLQLPEGAQARFEVLRFGKPYPNAEIFLCGFGGDDAGMSRGLEINRRQSRSTWRVLDADASTTVDCIGSGSWVVGVRDLDSGLVTSVRVELRVGHQVVAISFDPLEVRGRVMLPGGAPVPGALILLTDNQQSQRSALGRFHSQGYDIEQRSASQYASESLVYAVADQNGRFIFPRAALGADLFVYATARGHTTACSDPFRIEGSAVVLPPLLIEPSSELKVTAPSGVQNPRGVLAPRGATEQQAFAKGSRLNFKAGFAIRRDVLPGPYTIVWFSSEMQSFEEAHVLDVDIIPGGLTTIILEAP